MSSHGILLVDDESNVLRSLCRALMDEDYELETAANGEEGLAILDRRSFTLILSDQRMPGMSGVEFLKEAKRRYPNTVRIILSGYVEVNSILDAINEGEVYRFIHKPWNDEELKTVIRQSIRHYELVEENRQLQRQITKKNQELEKWARQLEERVTDRTRALELSNKVLGLAQDILEGLPIAVLGIGKDGLIALTNAEANRLFANKGLVLGQYIENALPEGLAAMLRSVFDSGQPFEILRYQDGDNELRILCQHARGFAGTEERIVMLAEDLGKDKLAISRNSEYAGRG